MHCILRFLQVILVCGVIVGYSIGIEAAVFQHTDLSAQDIALDIFHVVIVMAFQMMLYTCFKNSDKGREYKIYQKMGFVLSLVLGSGFAYMIRLYRTDEHDVVLFLKHILYALLTLLLGIGLAYVGTKDTNVNCSCCQRAERYHEFDPEEEKKQVEMIAATRPTANYAGEGKEGSFV